MTKRIFVCGKGGVGKTTVVCGILRYLLDKVKFPVLVVDADPNSILAENLGIKYDITIADIREELRSGNIPSNISKSEYINMRLQECISEQKGFDFIAMGYPEGRECYCFINELLRNFLSNLSKSYKYVLIDTEAGMEHLSRRTTDNIDMLLIISTSTTAYLNTVEKILDLVNRLKLKIFDKKILLNLVENDKLPKNIKFDCIIHKDIKLYNYSEEGIPLLDKISTTNFYAELKNFLDILDIYK